MEEIPRCVLRHAIAEDISALQGLIAASVRALLMRDYSETQIECALRTAFTVDTQLIEDGTYFVVEQNGLLIGCGGWSRRKTLCGGDHSVLRDNALLDPRCEAAKIRAFFVHPNWVRCGIGSLILNAAEQAATIAGFTRFEMGATLTGVPFYRRRGYEILNQMEVPLEAGISLSVVHMERSVN